MRVRGTHPFTRASASFRPLGDLLTGSCLCCTHQVQHKERTGQEVPNDPRVAHVKGKLQQHNTWKAVCRVPLQPPAWLSVTHHVLVASSLFMKQMTSDTTQRAHAGLHITWAKLHLQPRCIIVGHPPCVGGIIFEHKVDDVRRLIAIQPNAQGAIPAASKAQRQAMATAAEQHRQSNTGSRPCGVGVSVWGAWGPCLKLETAAAADVGQMQGWDLQRYCCCSQLPIWSC